MPDCGGGRHRTGRSARGTVGRIGDWGGAAADGRAGRCDPIGLPGRLRQAVPGRSARRESSPRMPADTSRKSVGAMPDRGGSRHRTGRGTRGTVCGIGDRGRAHDTTADDHAGWCRPVGLRNRLRQAVSGGSARWKGRGRMPANAYRDGVAAMSDCGGGCHRHPSTGALTPGGTAHAHPAVATTNGGFSAGRTGRRHPAGRCQGCGRAYRHGRSGGSARHGRGSAADTGPGCAGIIPPPAAATAAGTGSASRPMRRRFSRFVRQCRGGRRPRDRVSQGERVIAIAEVQARDRCGAHAVRRMSSQFAGASLSRERRDRPASETEKSWGAARSSPRQGGCPAPAIDMGAASWSERSNPILTATIASTVAMT
jgi:hypothetical protein